MSVAVLLPVAGVIAAIIVFVLFSMTLMRRTRRARHRRTTSGTVQSPRPDQGPMRQPPTNEDDSKDATEADR